MKQLKDKEATLRDILLRAADKGEILEQLAQSLFEMRGDKEELISELVSLHNEGKIDLVAEFSVLRNGEVAGGSFFAVRRFLRRHFHDLRIQHWMM